MEQNTQFVSLGYLRTININHRFTQILE